MLLPPCSIVGHRSYTTSPVTPLWSVIHFAWQALRCAMPVGPWSSLLFSSASACSCQSKGCPSGVGESVNRMLGTHMKCLNFWGICELPCLNAPGTSAAWLGHVWFLPRPVLRVKLATLQPGAPPGSQRNPHMWRAFHNVSHSYNVLIYLFKDPVSSLQTFDWWCMMVHCFIMSCLQQVRGPSKQK